jgi:hypothetical protein
MSLEEEEATLNSTCLNEEYYSRHRESVRRVNAVRGKRNAAPCLEQLNQTATQARVASFSNEAKAAVNHNGPR